jgi:hypothetical protein
MGRVAHGRSQQDEPLARHHVRTDRAGKCTGREGVTHTKGFAIAAGTLTLLALLPGIRPADARSLAGQLREFFDRNGFPTFGEFVEVTSPVVERLAVRGIDFPVTATTPAFTYRFDFETGVPERASEALGSVFAERADTVGKGQVDFGVWYLRADLTRFEGEEFGPRIVTAGVREIPGAGSLAQALVGRKFSLESQVVSFSLTYGITDRLDVNVLQPLVATRLRFDATAAALLSDGATERSIVEPVGLRASAFGVGDTLVRAKYQLLDTGASKLATLLTCRLPSGDLENFQGLGDTTVLGGIVASRSLGRHDVHASLGIELNADDLQRTRARYALGATLQFWERLAFFADVIGSSSFVNDEFEIRAPTGRVRFQGGFFGLQDLIESVEATRVVAFVPRSDIVDLAMGVKVNFLGRSVVFASAILPLTTDGLRPEVIPAAGVEVGF